MSGPTGEASGDARTPDDHGPAPSVVVLDVGEVLIDETRVWTVWAELLGISPFTMHALIGAAIVQGEPHQAALDFANPNVDWRSLRDEHEQRYGGFAEHDLYPDARGCIGALKEAGFTVLVAGNQPAQRDAQLADLELGVDGLATSAELGHDKPARAFYEAVMGMAAASDPAGLLYVGDRVDNDVLPAQAFGMRTCWLKRGPWGLLQDLPDDAEEPDLILEGLAELPELLAIWRDG